MSFPAPGSVPPVTFYTLTGLTDWLNRNPSYKQYFVDYPREFPYLYPPSTVQEWSSMASGPFSSMYGMYAGYDIERVPLGPLVTTLSQQQRMQNRDQLVLFQQVYGFNSNAWETGSRVWYRFSSSRELMEYRSAVSFVNKMYPFQAMANGRNGAGSTLGWVVPFPL